MTEIINTQKLVLEKLEQIAQQIRVNMDKAGVNASGRTRASIKVEEIPNGGRIVTRQFFRGLEEGRPAGNVPANFTSIIRQWIIDKGLTPTPIPYKTNRPHKYTEEERSLNTMASAIAWKIKREGYKPWRDGGRVPPPTTDIYSETIQKEVSNIRGSVEISMAEWVHSIFIELNLNQNGRYARSATRHQSN